MSLPFGIILASCSAAQCIWCCWDKMTVGSVQRASYQNLVPTVGCRSFCRLAIYMDIVNVAAIFEVGHDSLFCQGPEYGTVLWAPAPRNRKVLMYLATPLMWATQT